MADRWVRPSAAASVVFLLVSWALLGVPARRSIEVGGVAAPPSRPALLERVPYATGRVLDVHLPPGSSGRRQVPGSPVVVLVHGCCGDRSDLGRLAEAISGAGALVFNADWAGIDADARFPGAFEDVACAVRFAHARARDLGGEPARVVLAGWEDGALAATVVAAAGDGFDDQRCRYPRASPFPDAVVGIAGFYGWPLPVPTEYDTARAEDFFGGSPQSAPTAWERATPYAVVSAAPATVLLVGTTDPLTADARRYAVALQQARRTVRLVEIPPHGDQTLISPRTAEGRTVVAEVLGAACAVPDVPRTDVGDGVC